MVAEKSVRHRSRRRRPVDVLEFPDRAGGLANLPADLVARAEAEIAPDTEHAAALTPEHTVHAIDLPGFGASERRDDLLSPRAMGGFLARLIAEGYGLTETSPVTHVIRPDGENSRCLSPVRWRCRG